MSGLVWKPLGRVLGTLAGALEVSRDVLGVLCSLLEALEAPRRAKTAQDGCKACKDGFKLAGRAQRASERASEASEASEASGAIRMNLDVEKARDAEEGPRGSTSNWSNQRFQHHRRRRRIPSNVSKGHEDYVGKDVSHVLPRFFH